MHTAYVATFIWCKHWARHSPIFIFKQRLLRQERIENSSRGNDFGCNYLLGNSHLALFMFIYNKQTTSFNYKIAEGLPKSVLCLVHGALISDCGLYFCCFLTSSLCSSDQGRQGLVSWAVAANRAYIYLNRHFFASANLGNLTQITDNPDCPFQEFEFKLKGWVTFFSPQTLLTLFLLF